MALLLLFPLLMVGTVIAVALSADGFQSSRQNESDFHACCGAQKYANEGNQLHTSVEERELIAA